MDRFISTDVFEVQASERAEADRVYTWAELTTDSTIYKVVKIEPQESKYPGKLNGVITCETKSEERKIKIWAPNRLLTEILENAPKIAYFRCHGVSYNEKNGKSKFEYSIAFIAEKK